MQIGVVIIGRNEGDRLKGCIESLGSEFACVVYVDSGSTDGSAQYVRDKGLNVVELDLSRPFNASRARNEGFRRMMELCPGIERVQFIDGDCRLDGDWIAKALQAMAPDPQRAVVCGNRREQHPGDSIYNRLADLEWNRPSGETLSCGGDALMRVAALMAAGLFDETVPAGEEPELCRRIRDRGGIIWRIDCDMTWHDLAMRRFSQWWRRQYRGGYSGLDVVRRFGLQQFKGQIRSARIWTLGVLILALGLAAIGGAIHGWPGAAIGAGAGLLPVFLQSLKLFLQAFRREQSIKVSFFFAVLTLLSKWGQLMGQLGYHRDHASGHGARLIEYKNTNGAGTTNTSPSAFKMDLNRYPKRPWFKEQSIWAIAVYRFGQWGDRRKFRICRWIFNRIYWLVFRIVETLTGLSFCKTVQIGPGLRIYHFGNIFIHNNVVIGANCTLRQGVTIGNRHDGGPVPVLEDDVECGAYAQILGGVRIGKGAKIGALSVVLCDVPPGATAVGIPAKIISKP